jgi:hypothetical protein
MTTRFTAPDGARVDVITLSLTGTGDDGQWYRVTGRYGEAKGMARTPAELEELGITIANLTEVKK